MPTAVSIDRRAEIISTALRLVDRAGLDALSMRRLAAELGLGTMTLYGYFRTKEELLDAVVEASASGTLPEMPPDAGWEQRLRMIARAWHHGLNRHPSLVELRLRRPILGPEAFRSTEAGIAALIAAGFSPELASRAFRLLFVYVFGTAAFNENEVSRARRREVAAAILSLPEDEFPVISEMGGVMAGALGGEEQFEFGLDVLLAGLRAAAIPQPPLGGSERA
jgi:AcrR family transcriptional regulator